MDEFRQAFRDFLTRRRLLCKEVGAMLDPPASVATISNWLNGRAEPKKGHRAQLVKMSRGIIKPHHFL
jgi:hypothetical protein